MEKHINTLILCEVGQKLAVARARKGLSQRALAQATGIPQTHISKIEQGRVDIRLSSLVELARALDLDVQLVPRQALPAVEGAVRAAQVDAIDSIESRALATLNQQERTLATIRDAYPDLAAAKDLLPTIRDLKLAHFNADALKALQRALEPTVKASQQLGAGLDAVRLAKLLEETQRSLRALRNSLAHSLRLSEPGSQRPAFVLDDENDGD